MVEYSGGLPTFLAGDFNMQNTSQGFQYLEDYGTKPLSDAFRIYHGGVAPFAYTTTYNFTSNYSPLNAKRIDYIFMSSAVHVEDCWIPHASYGGNENYTYSDHFPVIGDFHF